MSFINIIDFPGMEDRKNWQA